MVAGVLITVMLTLAAATSSMARQSVLAGFGQGEGLPLGWAGPLRPVEADAAGVPALGASWLGGTFFVAARVIVATASASTRQVRSPQHAVDRRFNRARYDADQTVAAFAARLQDAVELSAISADLLGIMDGALEPTHVSQWTGPGG